jgi:acyl-CoA synthetase (AMP-forming)/AMP-acid ligase II
MLHCGTIWETFAAAAAAHGPRPFLHIPAVATRGYAEGPVDWSYAEAWAEVGRLRGCYEVLGLVAGERVALLLGNRAETLLHWFALAGLGVSIVPISAELRAGEIAHILRHSEAVMIVAWPEHHAALRSCIAGFDTPPVLFGPDLRGQMPARVKPERLGIGPDTEVALLYTSGTTGAPKGCRLSNDYVLELGRQYVGLGHLCAFEIGRERMLTPLPLTHMNALCCTPFAMMLTGGCLIQLDRFHASSWWQTVRDSGATCLHYLGVMPAILLNAPERPEDSLAGQVKFGFGAGVDPRHQQRFERRFGFPLIEAWSMTETGAGGWISMHREPRILGARCIGRPLPHMEIRLVDEAGAEVPDGEAGELLVRTHGQRPRRYFFSGYFGDEAATEAAWAGGWFHTGDVVRCDAEGNYFFVDRRKNVIRRSGENIAAVEVEGSLYQHAAVATCAVMATPDELRGDEVLALVVLAPGWPATRETAGAVAAHVAAQLAYYKAPGWIGFVDALPMTASQKIQRAEAKALAARMIEAGEVFDLRDAKRKRPKMPAAGRS